MNLSVALKNRPLCHGNANKLADTTEWVNGEKKSVLAVALKTAIFVCVLFLVY